MFDPIYTRERQPNLITFSPDQSPPPNMYIITRASDEQVQPLPNARRAQCYDKQSGWKQVWCIELTLEQVWDLIDPEGADNAVLLEINAQGFREITICDDYLE